MNRQTRGPSGRKITITAPAGGYSSGDIVPIRAGVSGWCGVAVVDIAESDTGIVEHGGEVEVAKNTGGGESFAVGALAYRSTSTGLATATAGSNDLIGAVTEAVGTSASTVWVQLGAST